MAWWKILVHTFQQVLLVFSSYEFGKNSELENQQQQGLVVGRNIIEDIKKSPVNNEPPNGLWIVIGLVAFAVTLYIIGELKDFLSCKKRGNVNQIELQNIQPRAAARHVQVEVEA